MRIWNQTIRQRARQHAHGFTLIEILLVIVIILLLAGALVVYILPQQKGAEKNTTRILLQQVQQALDNYRLNLGHYPTEDEGGLGALLVKPNYDKQSLSDKWQGPYLKPGSKLEDAWGNKLIYVPNDLATATASSGGAGTSASDNSAPALPYKLYSAGPDGQPDTDDDIKLFDDTAQNADSKSVLDNNNAKGK